MKIYFLPKIVFLILCFAVLKTNAQSIEDYNYLISNALSRSEFKPKLPIDAKNQPLPLVVMHHGIDFPNNLAAKAYDQNVLFKTKAEINATHLQSFFLFREIRFEGSTARVELTYNYNYNGSYVNYISAVLRYTKKDNTWQLVDANVGGNHE